MPRNQEATASDVRNATGIEAEEEHRRERHHGALAVDLAGQLLREQPWRWAWLKWTTSMALTIATAPA